MKKIIVVTGGQRSGKSSFAQRLAEHVRRHANIERVIGMME